MQRRQTVFYTPDTLAVQAGDQISGELTCAPNARNPRDLDIVISYKAPTDVQPTTIQYKMCVIPFRLSYYVRTNGCERMLTSCQVLINLYCQLYTANSKLCCHCYFWGLHVSHRILIVHTACHLMIAHGRRLKIAVDDSSHVQVLK